MTLRGSIRTVLITSFCCVIASCSQNYNFAGVVLDGFGEPIAGATFAINPSEWARPDYADPDIVSDTDGAFQTWWGSATGVTYFRFTTECEGYQSDCRIVQAEDLNLRIVLARSKVGD